MHGRICQTIDQVRDAVRDFIARYNAEWLIEENGLRKPSETRAAWYQRVVRAAALPANLCPKNRARYNVFCSFLTLILRKELGARCRTTGLLPEWGDVLRDLDRLQEVVMEKDGRQMTLRTPATGLVGPLFRPPVSR